MNKAKVATLFALLAGVLLLPVVFSVDATAGGPENRISEFRVSEARVSGARVLEQSPSEERVLERPTRGFLGVQVDDLTSSLRLHFGVSDDVGVLVSWRIATCRLGPPPC